MKFPASWLVLAMMPAIPVFAIQHERIQDQKIATPGISAAAISTSENKMRHAEVKKITALLFASELEPCIDFWTQKLGFQKTMEVPEGNKIGFVILEKNGMELMYQNIASAEKDNPATGAAARKGPSFLYIEVADIGATYEATKGAEIVMPMRTTFYHSKEFGIKDPAGHYFIFAQQGAGEEK
jgi:uncharacterized glyoxalase superfamily protein PhnB